MKILDYPSREVSLVSQGERFLKLFLGVMQLERRVLAIRLGANLSRSEALQRLLVEVANSHD